MELSAVSPNLEIGRLNIQLAKLPTAEGLSLPERREALQLCVDGLQSVVNNGWELNKDALHSKYAFRSAWLLASEPILQTIASGRRPGREESKAVHANNEQLADTLWRSPFSGVEFHSGIIAEFAVNALLTWAIATEHTPEQSYALPAAPEHDGSTTHGQRNGFDLILRTNRRRYPIQVKNGHAHRPKERPYLPGITVVGVKELLPGSDKHFVALDLLYAIAQRKYKTLGSAYSVVRHRLDETERTVRHARQMRHPHVKIAV